MEGAALALRLEAEAEAWSAPRDLEVIPVVEDDDLPVIDLGDYLSTDSESALARVAEGVRDAGERVGFMFVVNHGLDECLERGYEASRAFHEELSDDAKVPFADGSGFLRTENYTLPKRDLPNFNESFVIKRELGPRNMTLEKVPWPKSKKFDSEKFEKRVRALIAAYEGLALRLLPIYARALDLPLDYFDNLFSPSPVLRMRLASYATTPAQNFGINPHVDTSFFTLLASTDFSGLVIYSKEKQSWLRAKNLPDHNHPLIVNTGQMLAQLTNDQWPATRHFAFNPTPTPRLSLPFFFNADAQAPLAVLPSKCSDSNPPRYPTLSYLQSQAIQQGE